MTLIITIATIAIIAVALNMAADDEANASRKIIDDWKARK